MNERQMMMVYHNKDNGYTMVLNYDDDVITLSERFQYVLGEYLTESVL